MISAIVVLVGNTCHLVSGAEKAMLSGESVNAFYDRVLDKSHPDRVKYILRSSDDLPRGRIEEWIYNPTTDQIDFSEIIMVDWDGLETEMRDIGQSAKASLGTYYLLYAQAIKDKDEEYLKSSYALMVADTSITTQVKETVIDKFIGLGVQFP